MPYSLHQYLRDAGVPEWPASLPDFPMSFPDGSDTPAPHQISGLRNALAYPRYGLFDDAGTGKSAIMQAYALYFVGYGNKVALIMPPILLPQFHSSFGLTYGGCHDWMTAAVIPAGEKGPKVRKKLFKIYDATKWPEIVMMSYEMFVKLHSILSAKEYNVVIADEAHKLRGSESTMHATVYNYTDNEYETTLLLATGTPLHHTPVDGYAMTRLLDREAYGSLKGFERQHCIIKSFPMQITVNRKGRSITKTVRTKEIVGFKNLELLNRRLYKHARRVTKDEVLSLEKPRIIPVDIEMAPEHRKIYETMASERMLELADDVVLTATQATQLREHLMQIACNPQDYSDKPITNNLLEESDAILDSIGLRQHKVLMYAHHNRTIENLAERYAEYNPAVIYGGKLSSAAKNSAAVARFKTDNECRLAISHPQSGGVGLDFQYVCHYLMFVEPTSIQGDFLQVLARVQRKGQEHAVVAYILRLLGTVYPGMVADMLDNSDRAAIVNADGATIRKWVLGG